MADTNELIALTADIVSSMVANNKVSNAELPDLIGSIHAALSQTANPVEPEAPAQAPAASVRSSIKNDYIVCLEDGKKLKMLKRYLRTNYNLSPVEYRAKWNLPPDYPMVAPAYAETRRGLAHASGLGRKVGSVMADAVEGAADTVEETVVPKAAAKRGRPAGSKNTKTLGIAKPKATKPPKALGSDPEAA